MVKKLKACRNCRYLTEEKICPKCKSTTLSTIWKGVAIIINKDSEIAKALNIGEEGVYATYIE